MKKIKMIVGLFSLIYVTTFTSMVVFAHSGDTDEYGGHNDYNNVSGLGAYHYHHGFSAHLHYEDGGCPFLEESTSSGNFIIENEQHSYEDFSNYKLRLEREGYTEGYAEGYAEKDRKKSESFDDYYFAKGYTEGYEKGHSKINEKNLIAYQDGYEDGLNNINGDNYEIFMA